MKITYTGKQTELTPKQQAKLDAKFAKFSKLLERKGEKEAHVVITTERHLQQAEVTLNIYSHSLVGVGSDTDPFTAICDAVDKMEKQILKLRAKWRDTKRKSALAEETLETVSVEEEGSQSGKVYRVNHSQARKPMTIEEAMLEMESGQDYLVYNDAEKGRLSVLVRRRDGNFDLIEG